MVGFDLTYLKAVEPVLRVAYPAQQSLHTVRPGSIPYVPYGQGVQDVLPVVELAVWALKVPSGHREHLDGESSPVSVEKVPSPHVTHRSTELAPTTVEYVPAGQGVQDGCRRRLLYVPVGHRRHVLRLAGFDVWEYMPGGQLLHWDMDVDPDRGAKLPDGHGVHDPLSA